MANKFILVPEDIYRGLTTNDVGEPNLDFTRHALERSKRRKESNSSKNVHYNQELRRYLQLRNERENRPVKVEVVNKSKGVIIPKTNSRPATYISSAANDNDGNDDDYWISDNLSFSSYPREAPNDAYNIVPPLSSSSNPSSIPIELDPRPSTSSQVLKRNVKDNGDEESKRFKINKEIKKKGKPKKKINKKQKVTIEHGSVIASQNAPLSPSPPLPQDVSKREHELNVFDPFKRRKIGIKTEKQREIAQAERRKNLAERRRYARKYKVPIDQLALAQARREDDIKRRQKLKRKWQGPEPVDMVRRVVRRPTGMNSFPKDTGRICDGKTYKCKT
uniref:Uncharacterized protein n=1 Tax=Meloidogyne hapla TaxID=6305 RepID=A0A1I8AWS8_MELHA